MGVVGTVVAAVARSAGIVPLACTEVAKLACYDVTILPSTDYVDVTGLTEIALAGTIV